MVLLISLAINIVSMIHFGLDDMLLACELQPAWEHIISRTAHARVVSGELATVSARVVSDKVV